MKEVFCDTFTGYTIELILKRINRWIEEYEGEQEIINIETVRSMARQIEVRVWWTV